MATNGLLALNGLQYFILALTVLVLTYKGVDGGDMLPLGASLRGNQTLISKNGTFELGFFSPEGTNNWYVGIWYAQIPHKTIVWVANRKAPVKNMPGVLNMSIDDGYLSVSEMRGQAIWSSSENQKAKASSALILDSGNLIMLGADNTSEIVWESFRYPTDTVLPGMKMWKGVELTSWKSSVDPAPGLFSLAMDPSAGKSSFYMLYNNSVTFWDSGEWNVNHFANLPIIPIEALVDEDFKRISPSSMYWVFSQKSQTIMVRKVLDRNGQLIMYFWVQNDTWSPIWSGPLIQCSVYAVCGAYGVCTGDNMVHSCNCVQGFQPLDDKAWNSQQWWSSGCVRSSSLDCTTDGFLQVSDKSLPDKAIEYGHEPTLQGCRTACLKNCSCTAFGLDNSDRISRCKLWFGDLYNMRNSSDGQRFFIRLAASELQQRSSKESRRRRTVRALWISLPAAGAAFTVALAFLFGVFIRRGRRNKVSEEDDEPMLLRTFTYKELQIATRNFKHKLGRGGFGSVFKGTLPDNTYVAVKKLEGFAPAEKQFRAEISTIGNIHHTNLVRLLGFCAAGSQRLLVYEYMPNGSLNSFLSCNSEEPGKLLDWNTRFEIALGTAKGLIYLHDKCKDQIIHLDIKPENILLDNQFYPKVADFGLAKLVGRDFSRVLTSTRGTRGYMAPEWIYGIPITAKADVYSFGMTLLEIISGRRNLDFTVQQSSKYYFPSWATTQIQQGNTMGIVDERIANSADVEEVRRACMVSMLCIQEDENKRPTMAEVLLMLEGNTEIDTPQINRSLQELADQYGEE